MSKDVIDKLSDTIAIYKEESNIIAMGDFYVMLISAPVTCNGSALTFIPYTDASPTLIDHILTYDYVESLVQQCSVLEDAPLNVSRHLLVHFSLQTNSDIYTGFLSE